MAILSKGTDFSTGDQVTATKLDNLVDAATFASGAVDSSTTQLSGSGQIIVKDSGISTAKIADDAVTTAKILNSNVTKAKIENVADMKVLGNTSGSATAPQEVSVLDEDNMSSDSNTSIATQQSIKAYVDNSSTDGFTPTSYNNEESVTFPNGLIMKWGSVDISANSTSTVTFGASFNTIFNAQITWHVDSNSPTNPCYLRSEIANASIDIRNNIGQTVKVYWQAIGK